MTETSPEIRRIKKQEAQKDYSPAYFLSLELENVLCFKSRQKLNLSDVNGFPAQWTVILGDNGVGKTTLLRCLAGMEPHLGDFREASEVPYVVPRFNIAEIRPWHELIKPPVFENKVLLAHLAYGGSLKSWKEFFIGKVKETPIIEKAFFEMHIGPFTFGSSILEDVVLGLKCYGYGANRRMGDTSLTEALSSDRCSSLFSDDEVLINAEEWLLQADYAVARSTPSNTARLQQRFNFIRDTLKQLLPDVFDIRITPADDNYPRPVAEFHTPYGWVSLENLSLGYKTVIAWTVDLAARMLDRYPLSEDPLAEPAVVLIDEIDLHLHPKWQRTIMTFLTERFTNTQFIVTAHSPLVVQAAKNANIVLLHREGDHVVIDNDPEVIDNWRVDQVLTSVFELPTPHSAEIEPLIERRRKLLSKPKLTAKDERELKKLEEQIGSLPTAESPEDIRAMDIIRKAAKLLENN